MTVEGPDRGYSWVIVLCCAYIHFALFGVFRSWGAIYVAVLQTYDVTREEASWPFSLCSAVFQLIGPAVSIITHYVSKRVTCLLGSTIATIGIVACYFAQDVMWIIIFYGVVHGLGFGIVVTLIPVFLNEYFAKHRASAIGIAFSGGSIGSFIVPIAMEWLLENYNLRGSFLLLGGIVMNTLVASSLLKTPSWLKKSKRTSLKLLEDSEGKDSGVSTDDSCAKIKELLSVDGTPSKCDSRDSVFNDIHGSADNTSSSLADVSQIDCSKADEVFEKHETLLSNNDSMYFDCSGESKVYADPISHKIYDYNKDIIIIKGDPDIQEPLMNKNPVCIISKQETPIKKRRRFKCSAHHSIAEILKNPMFHLIAYTMFIYFFALQCFFVVILDYGKDKGIPEVEGVYIMSIFSITDLIGRSCLGWITDRNFIKRKNMVIIDLIIIGAILQLYPLIDHLIGLLTVAAFHGIISGSCITLFFVLQAEYLGMKRLTLVIGLTSFINGALTLLRPGTIGLFRDTIGSYDWMFHSLGIISFLFAFIWLAESWINRERKMPNHTSNEKI